MPKVTLAALELPHRFGEPSLQLAAVDRLLAAASGADLALLPECALTGYVSAAGDFDLARFAEPLEGPTAASLARLAQKHQLALAAPLIERAQDLAHNAFVVFDRTGARIAHYRKRHPWYPETWAAPGALPHPLFEVAGARFTLAICFDLHFLEADAAAQLTWAQVLLFPSAWVTDSAIDERDLLLPQLARAFGVAVVNANWGPGSPWLPGQGGSRILDAEGRERARAAAAPLGSVTMVTIEERGAASGL